MENLFYLFQKLLLKLVACFNIINIIGGHVLEYMQEDALSGGKYSDSVLTLKNEKRVIYKNYLESEQPCTKEFLYRFSREHSDVLERYRQELVEEARKDELSDVDKYDEKTIAEALSHSLQTVSRGRDDANKYHNLMKGILEFIFFPVLNNPVKEKEIDEGRKRIDIVMDNAARDGIFWRLHQIMGVSSGKVSIECKNYVTEVSNPELDQLAGRLNLNTGMFGVLCCRHFEKREVFIKRCRHSWHAQKQLMVPLDDKTVLVFLKIIADGKKDILDRKIQELIEEVWH